jgi:polyhydroxyalkanoate synthase
MWNESFKRWIDLFFWWLPRKEQTPPEKAEESAPSVTEQSAGRGPEQAVEQQGEAVKEVIPDDLTVIKGIGLAVQEKLRSLGITTFRDLATADPDDLVDQLKASLPVSKARVRGWIEAARERTRARE